MYWCTNRNGCGLIKDLKTRYLKTTNKPLHIVVVWLKIWKHDIEWHFDVYGLIVVVWLKIWKHDIDNFFINNSHNGCGLIKDLKTRY